MVRNCLAAILQYFLLSELARILCIVIRAEEELSSMTEKEVHLKENELTRFHAILLSLEQMKSANKSQSHQILHDIYVLCEYLKSADHNDINYCPYLFDGTTCWRPTVAGTVSKRHCPIYVDGFYTPDKQIKLLCKGDATWDFNSSNIEEFLNLYRKCAIVDENSENWRSKGGNLTSVLKIAQLIGAIGYTVSMISLTIAAVIFLYFKRLHCARNMVHLHLFLAFILRSFMCVLHYSLFRNGKTTPFDGEIFVNEYGMEHFADDSYHWPCKLIVTLWNYSLLISYFWLFMEGLYLHNVVHLLVFREAPLPLYITLGWGLPAILILPWILVKLFNENYLCWVQYQNMNNFWILRGPIMCTIIINFCLCVNICRDLFIKLKESHLREQQRYKRLAKSTSLLITVLGGYYFIISLPVLAMETDTLTKGLLACLSIEHILSSLQGLFVAIIYCFCNHEVRAEIKRYHQRRLLLKSIPKPTELLNHNIVTRSGKANVLINLKPKKDLGPASQSLAESLPTETDDRSRLKRLWQRTISKVVIIKRLDQRKKNTFKTSIFYGVRNSGTAFSTLSNSVYSTVHHENSVMRQPGEWKHKTLDENATPLLLNHSMKIYDPYRLDARPSTSGSPSLKKMFLRAEDLLVVMEESSSNSSRENSLSN